MTSATLDTYGAFARDPRDFDLLADTFDIYDDESTSVGPLDLSRCSFAFYQTTEWQSAGPGTQGNRPC